MTVQEYQLKMKAVNAKYEGSTNEGDEYTLYYSLQDGAECQAHFKQGKHRLLWEDKFVPKVQTTFKVV